MATKLIKRNSAIAIAVIALIFAAVVVGLAGCENPVESLDLGGTETTSVDTGPTISGEFYGKSIPVASVTISPKTLSLYVGDTAALTAEVLPANATNPTVTWTSGDADVAAVDSATGVVTGIARGTAEITATADGTSDTCTVTVLDQYPSFTFNMDSASLSRGSFTFDMDMVDASPGMTDVEIGARITAAVALVAEFKSNIDPLPFLDNGNGIWETGDIRAVKTGPTIQTSPGDLVIHRYWPDSLGAATVSDYLTNTEGDRAMAFKAAANKIEVMVDTIGNSSLCGYSGTDTAKNANKAALEEIRSTLEGLLSLNPAPEDCKQRGDIVWNIDGEATLNNSGFLYEYFLGPIPATTGEYGGRGVKPFPY